jgi:TolA-binding protein
MRAAVVWRVGLLGVLGLVAGGAGAAEEPTVTIRTLPPRQATSRPVPPTAARPSPARVGRSARPRVAGASAVRRGSSRPRATVSAPTTGRQVAETRRVRPRRVVRKPAESTSPTAATSKVAKVGEPREGSKAAGRPRTRVLGTRVTHRSQAVALNDEGYRLLRAGRFREAEPLLRQALELNPDYAYAQYNLGWCLVEQGKGRDALPYLRRTAEQQSERWEPQARLAEAYEQAGETAKAEQARERAAALRRGLKPSDRGAAVGIKSRLSDEAWHGAFDAREEAFLTSVGTR